MADEYRSYTNRGRAESFGSAAENYDRFRPSYPPELIDDVLADGRRDVLDVGCGTGKAAVLLAAGGARVLGVEIDPRMAEVAREHEIEVEVASFEAWEPAGRTFDAIVSGQAWHWIDPTIGVAKAAALLRPGGLLALFWNYSRLDEPVRAAVAAAYEREAPDRGGSVTIAVDPFEDDGRLIAELGACFVDIEVRTYAWERVYSRDEWLAMVNTHSDHITLDPPRRERLMAALAQTIDELGGSVDPHYATHTVLAHVR